MFKALFKRREFRVFLQDKSGRYSSTWTIIVKNKDIYVTSPSIGGTSVVMMESGGQCHFLFTPQSKELAAFAHIPPCEVDSWSKKEVEPGLFKLLDIHMPHNLLSGNPLFVPSSGYKISPCSGYDVTRIGLFESRQEFLDCRHLTYYESLHTMKISHGRFLHIIQYGSSLTFPQYTGGEQEFYIQPANRLVATHICEEDGVGYLVDVIPNRSFFVNALELIDNRISKFGEK